MSKFIVTTFPIWALLLAFIAFQNPEWFAGQSFLIVPLLSAIMLGMGLTLRVEDFQRVIKQPKLLLLGMLMQFGVMPLAAFLLSRLLALPPELMIGMILVGSSAGGTASNVICYLAGASVPLSISLTLCSTVMAVVLLPLLSWIYIGQVVTVPVIGMMKTVFMIVLIPVAIGVFLNVKLPGKTKRLHQWSPLLSVFALVWIIAIIVALNVDTLSSIGWRIGFAVALHNLVGLGVGYWVVYTWTRDRVIARTLAIEVGMQNSGLSVALANQFFSPAAALPGAIFSIWHNLSGSVMAAWFRIRQKSEMK